MRTLPLTNDAWTASSANISFINLTCHWITGKFEQKSAILRFTPFEASHTAHHMSECLKEPVQQFSNTHNNIHVIVKDNIANMAAGVQDAEYDSLPCFLHTLLLTISNVIFVQG